MSLRLPRRQYADLYGPTVGDRVRLADTDLLIEVERDFTVYGDEIKFGGGKVIRDGMGQSARATSADGVLDLVITNALVLDHWGIVKCDIGVRGGRIVGVGKAGNPDIQAGVTPGMIVGASTEVIAGEGRIVTAGGIDSHIHFICPQLDRRGALGRPDDPHRRRHGPRDRHQRHDLLGGSVEHPPDARGLRRPADQPGLPREGECFQARPASGAGVRGRHRAQASRRLGNYSSRHRRLPLSGRGDGHPGRDSHGHAERGGLRRGLDQGLQGPDHPHVSHGRRGRRPRARHHQGLRRA